MSEENSDPFMKIAAVGAYAGAALGAIIGFSWFGIGGAIVAALAFGFACFWIAGIGSLLAALLFEERKEVAQGLLGFFAVIFVLWAIIHFWGVR